jgi:hypothetical protein
MQKLSIERLSAETQAGLRLWAAERRGDELLFDAISGNPVEWAWISFQLRVAEDKPEWFPKGKFAIIQTIEGWLYDAARAETQP